MSGLMAFYVIFGLLLTVLAIPLWEERIGPNGLYGFRVRRTLENEEVWYAVNKYFAPWLAATGLLTAFAALSLYYLPGISLAVYPLGVLALFVIIFLLGVQTTLMYMRSL